MERDFDFDFDFVLFFLVATIVVLLERTLLIPVLRSARRICEEPGTMVVVDIIVLGVFGGMLRRCWVGKE